MSTNWIWIKIDHNWIRINYSTPRPRSMEFVIKGRYNYEEIKEKNKVINNHIIEDFAIKRYSPKKFINLNSPNWEKEMEEYISVYE
jgi:hypothetical protein